MLNELKQEVLQANLELERNKLVIYTWGNASGIDRGKGLVVIKPSGLPYNKLNIDSLVVLSLDGQVVEGSLKPSSDAPTHLCLYQEFPEISGIVHTHSRYATIWAQARLDIPCLGTTHADYFYGAIPCTRMMTPAEVEGDYETNTARVISERMHGLDCEKIPAILVAGHGPFTWGQNAGAAVHNSVVLEEIARMAWAAKQLNPSIAPLPQYLLDKHFLRKHGAGAYYGQKPE